MAPRNIFLSLFHSSVKDEYRHNESQGLIQLLAPLAKSVNDVDKEGKTPIFLASKEGNLDIIKILAPLASNDPNQNGITDYRDEDMEKTPMHIAAENGDIEIVKFLAPLTDNPNPSAFHDFSDPMSLAIDNGKLEIVQILAPLAKKNYRLKWFKGCIENAYDLGETEIAEYLDDWITEFCNPDEESARESDQESDQESDGESESDRKSDQKSDQVSDRAKRAAKRAKYS